MSKYADVLWLNTCTSLLDFNLPTIEYLSHHLVIA